MEKIEARRRRWAWVALGAIATVVAAAGWSLPADQREGRKHNRTGTWRLEMSFMFRGPVGEFDSGQVVRVKLGPSVAGVFASSGKTTLEFAGSTFDSVSNPTTIDDGAWHRLRLDLASANGGADTDYTLAIDGNVVLSGTAAGTAFLPGDAVASPFGDLAEFTQPTVSGIEARR